MRGPEAVSAVQILRLSVGSTGAGVADLFARLLFWPGVAVVASKVSG